MTVKDKIGAYVYRNGAGLEARPGHILCAVDVYQVSLFFIGLTSINVRPCSRMNNKIRFYFFKNALHLPTIRYIAFGKTMDYGPWTMDHIHAVEFIFGLQLTTEIDPQHTARACDQYCIFFRHRASRVHHDSLFRYHSTVRARAVTKSCHGRQPSERTLRVSRAYRLSWPGLSLTNCMRRSSFPRRSRMARVSSRLVISLPAPIL